MIIFVLFFFRLFYFNLGTFNIIYTSDVNSNLYNENFYKDNCYVGGIFALPYILNNYNLENSVFVDSGNFFLNRYSIKADNYNFFVKIFNLLNYDIINIGSGEFTFGLNSLAFLNNNFNISFVSSNIYSINDYLEKNNSDFCSYFVKQLKDVKIGILGISNNEIFFRNFKNNLSNYDLLPLFQTLKYYVNILKKEEKVDFIILLSRYNFDNGFDKYNLYIDNSVIAKEISDIDVIISSSDKYNAKFKIFTTQNNKNVFLSSVEENLKNIGILKIIYKKYNKKIINFNNEFIDVKVPKNILLDFYSKKYPNILKTVKKFLNNLNRKKIYSKINFELFKTNSKEYDNLTFFVADIIKKKTKVDIAIIQKGDLKFDHINKENLYYENIYDLFIDNYKLVTLELKGKDLITLLEKNLTKQIDNYIVLAGAYYYYNLNKVENLVLLDKKEQFNPYKYYKICLLEKMLYNKNIYSLHAISKNIKYTDFNIIDIVVEYMSTFVPIDEKYKYENLYEDIKKYAV